MDAFEPIERDGLARRGLLRTPHGAIVTPALLPVVHPDAARQPIPSREIADRFGLRALITSAYIAWRTPALRQAAEATGIHGLLGFDGPVMTDSGAFQQHAYGHVEVGPDEILEFQNRIGSDIATVLDVFVEPESDRAATEQGVATTLERARAARGRRSGLLAVPVQGGLHPDLRRDAARGASELGDVLAVGGVVPLLERYRFAELARALRAARPGLAPERAVHLFGTGHPMTFAFAALFGVDLVDSSAYHKFARRGSLLFPDGSVSIETVRENLCGCAACAEVPLTEVARLPPAQREARIARHNLAESAREMARVRQAIRDGRLWELAERRAVSHPALLAGLRAVLEDAAVFLPFEPESRSSFRPTGPWSARRPALVRFAARLDRWLAGKTEPLRLRPRTPLLPDALRSLAAREAHGEPIRWAFATPVGPVPIELGELYPVGAWLDPAEFDPASRARADPEAVRTASPGAPDADWLPTWTHRHVAAVLEWTYGADVAARLGPETLSAERSRRTGRLRALRDTSGSRVFTFANDGIPRPTWRGAARLVAAAPPPRFRIVVDEDAAPFVAEGRSLFSRFVRTADPALAPGASAVLVDARDRPLAVARLVLAPVEMGRFRRGVAARVVAHARRPEAEVPPGSEPIADEAHSRSDLKADPVRPPTSVAERVGGDGGR
jgi:7-cyano-7-deazaguanine tRNA-ribosyltransferase